MRRQQHAQRSAIYFVARARAGGWRVRVVLEHGPYHDRRPASWRGPYASELDARRAIIDLEVEGESNR
jgi:hypothetical protein